ncbi:Actin-like 6A [Tyrophagus putrescentiae]|nr:Actin-like 6A [Tyrophagus putrescentiae]
MQYIYARTRHLQVRDHTAAVSEVVWNTKASRERFAELMFERYHFPALYVALGAMLVAFSTTPPHRPGLRLGGLPHHGRPVVDGTRPGKCMVKTRYAGDYVTGSPTAR